MQIRALYSFVMRKRRTWVFAWLLASAALAEAVETLQDEQGWIGFWAVKQASRFEAGVGPNGTGVCFLKKGDTTLAGYRAFPIDYVLEEKVGEKWKQRKLLEDGFEAEMKPTAKAKEAEFILNYEGGGKVRFVQKFSTKGFEVSAEVLEKSAEAVESRAGVQMKLPRFTGLDDEEARDLDLLAEKLQGDFVELVRQDGKRMSFELIEDVDLESEDVVGDGFRKVNLQAKVNLKYELEFSLEKKGMGHFEFQQRRKLFEGLRVIWYANPQFRGREAPAFTFSVK